MSHREICKWILARLVEAANPQASRARLLEIEEELANKILEVHRFDTYNASWLHHAVRTRFRSHVEDHKRRPVMTIPLYELFCTIIAIPKNNGLAVAAIGKPDSDLLDEWRDLESLRYDYREVEKL